VRKEETGFRELVILKPVIFEDSRGYFFEGYNKKKWSDLGLEYEFVQDNISCSKRATIRGLHFQKPPMAQTKLVSVIKGSILDVVVDLRESEPTFQKVFCKLLNDVEKEQLLVPKGFAHGFEVLSDEVIVQYKTDNAYSPQDEMGIRFDDPVLDIDWEISKDKAIVSKKDKELPWLSELNFRFK